MYPMKKQFRFSVCILYAVCSLHFVPCLQSAICSLHFALSGRKYDKKRGVGREGKGRRYHQSCFSMMPYLIQGCNDAVYVYICLKKLLIRVHGKGCSITYHLSHKHIKNTIIRDMGPLYFFLTAEANLSQFKFKLVALVGSKLSGSKRICSRSLIVEDFNTMECEYPLWFF